MREQWNKTKLIIKPYRDSETFIIQGADPIWDQLDEHIVKTMAIANSQYIRYLEGFVLILFY